MTNTQKLELRRSEIAARLAELAGGDDDLTAEETGEVKALMAESERVELRYQAAVKAAAVAPKPPVGRVAADAVAPLAAPLLPDDRELMELRNRVSLVGYANAALAGENPKGAEAEFTAAAGLPADFIPWAMLEQRATTTSDVGIVSNAALPDRSLPIGWETILPRVFASEVTGMLGITDQAVPVGQTEWPVMTAGSSPSLTGENVDDSTVDDADYELVTLRPKRLTSTMELTGEFMYLAPGIEESLRRDMGAAFADNMEKEMLVGTNAATPQQNDTNIGGLKHSITASTNPAAVTTWQEYAVLAANSVDGMWASSEKQVNLILPVRAFTYGLGLWQTTSSDLNGVQVLRMNSGGVAVSAHLPDRKGSSGAAAKVADCIAVRANGRVWAVRALWQGFRLIRDEYTKASSGVTRLTGVIYWDFDVVRQAAVSLAPVRHTA